jgi:TolB-like protein
VTRGGLGVSLGRLSFELLHVLAAAAPDVVTPAQLIDRVWRGRVVSPETVTQRVKLLRGALSDDAARPRYIGLVRRCGYRLIPTVERHCVKPRAPQRLAVLPFETLSQEPQDRYFATGMHEEILSRLAQMGELEVTARTSVRRYADTCQPIPEIASELGVGAVMEGSIRYAGKRVRITAQLIDGGTGTHLWAEVYERDLKDIFAVQTDVARRIATALRNGVAPPHELPAA